MLATFERRQEHRAAMMSMTERLVAEFSGQVPAGSVIRTVARCQARLYDTGVRQGLVDATEAMARQQLSGRIPAHGAA